MSRASPIVTVTAQIASDDAFGTQDDVSLMRAVLPGEDILAVFRPFAGDAPRVAFRPALASMQIPCLLPFVLCLSFKDSQKRYYRLLKTYYVIASNALFSVVTDEHNELVEDPVTVPFETIVRVVPKEQSSCTNPPSIHIQTISDLGNTGDYRDKSGFHWYTPEVTTCSDIIVEALYKSRYSPSHAPFAETVPSGETAQIRIFLRMKDNNEVAKIIRIPAASSWEEFKTVASGAMQLQVGSGIEYEYYIETDGALTRIEAVDMLEANDRVLITKLEE